MKVTTAIAATLLITGCPWDAQGNYIGERLPDGGIPASAYEEINLLEQWSMYAAKYGGKRSRPKPAIEQLCSFWPASAVREGTDGNAGVWEDVGIGQATTRAWVLAVLGVPPGGIGVESADSVVDAYRWDPIEVKGEKMEEGRITLVYQLTAGLEACQFKVANGEYQANDCDQWKLKEIRTQDPQVYLYCWRNADLNEARKLPQDLVMGQ